MWKKRVKYRRDLAPGCQIRSYGKPALRSLPATSSNSPRIGLPSNAILISHHGRSPYGSLAPDKSQSNSESCSPWRSSEEATQHNNRRHNVEHSDKKASL